MKKIIAVLMVMFIVMGILTSCSIAQDLIGQLGIQGGNSEDDKSNSPTIDVLNGEYGLHHIVVEKMSSGEKSTYNIGDTYLGLVMSSSTISIVLNNGSGTMTYDFGSVISTNITYEVVDDKFIMTCEDAVDILYGYPEHRYEVDIDEIDGNVCFVLTVSSAYSVYTYYVAALQ
jgi:hypothetical protein